MKCNAPTKVQQKTLVKLLTNEIDQEIEFFEQTSPTRAQTVKHTAKVLNLALILEQVCGVDGASKKLRWFNGV